MLRNRKIQIKLRDYLIAHPEVLHYLLDIFHVFETPYVRGGENDGADRETLFREGRQSAGHDLLRINNMSKRELVQLRAEEVSYAVQEQEELIDDD